MTSPWKSAFLLLAAIGALALAGCGGGGEGGGGGGSGGGSTDSTIQMGGARQGVELNLVPTVSTFAGTAATDTDSIGSAARFNQPYAVASDDANLYVADTYNHKIRKVVIATGEVTTLAGTGVQGAEDGAGASATFNRPSGITIDGANLYVADSGNHKIRQIVISTGEVSSVTGAANTPMNAGAADGPGATATFNNPFGITTDGINLYVADNWNHKIRQIVITTGEVTTLAGTGAWGATDGAGASATFNNPSGITTDGTCLYVADMLNNKIRQIVIATGLVSSVTGAANTAVTAGAADGAGLLASFRYPIAITTEGANLYVSGGDHKIRMIALNTRVVSSLTGTANTAGARGAADGAGASATFSSPSGITTVGAHLYIADTGNNAVRIVSLATAEVGTLAGEIRGGDGIGAHAVFDTPKGVTSDGTNLYVADTYNHKIRKIDIATGAVTTLAGTGAGGAADGPGASATFNYPFGITTDGTNLYVADTHNHKIRQIVIATGEVISLTGLADTASVAGAADGAGTSATFNIPVGVTTDGTNLYVADTYNHKIRKIDIATGAVTTLAGTGAGGAADGTGAVVMFDHPAGITTDGSHLYVADQYNHKIRKIVIATGEVSSLTGAADAAGTTGADDGAGTSATFNFPFGVTTDGTHLYVVDRSNFKIRKIALATGNVSSVTGAANTPVTAGAADGAGALASFNYPAGITSDGSSLYVTDEANHTIRKIE